MQELKTIKLLGAAGRKFGREFKVAVSSPSEAFRALCMFCPNLRAWVLEQHEKGVAWRVITDDAKGLKKDELDRETGAEVIIFAPVLQGAGGGGGGFFSIILGVVLIAAALIIPFAAAGGGLALGLLGGSLVLGGIAQLLTPTPVLPTQGKTGEEASQALESNLFTRNSGNDAQGEVVPVLYGERLVTAPRIVSFDLQLLPASRNIDLTSTGLLGYVNRTGL
jgi:predicted phage tail protein